MEIVLHGFRLDFYPNCPLLSTAGGAVGSKPHHQTGASFARRQWSTICIPFILKECEFRLSYLAPNAFTELADAHLEHHYTQLLNCMGLDSKF
jgi:hypothetical protein